MLGKHFQPLDGDNLFQRLLEETLLGAFGNVVQADLPLLLVDEFRFGFRLFVIGIADADVEELAVESGPVEGECGMCFGLISVVTL